MSDFKARMHQKSTSAGFRPKLCWEAYSAPRPPSWNKGDLLLRKGEGAGRGRGGERGGMGEELRGREGRREEVRRKNGGEGVEGTPLCIFKLSLDYPML